MSGRGHPGRWGIVALSTTGWLHPSSLPPILGFGDAQPSLLEASGDGGAGTFQEPCLLRNLRRDSGTQCPPQRSQEACQSRPEAQMAAAARVNCSPSALHSWLTMGMGTVGVGVPREEQSCPASQGTPRPWEREERKQPHARAGCMGAGKQGNRACLPLNTAAHGARASFTPAVPLCLAAEPPPAGVI